ncbi:hypothetical protein B0I35DRAFT_447544 [Stachybotrys elegans]|uniref:Uncharacterized protein n=1 Tax=Stachybotrys elegans TaxID=80388 RepID=A0A8K0SC36_9HYPO|nr:hypothetical protein B0I35DRAFT_447544 [Stachybotrys elegans]
MDVAEVESGSAAWDEISVSVGAWLGALTMVVVAAVADTCGDDFFACPGGLGAFPAVMPMASLPELPLPLPFPGAMWSRLLIGGCRIISDLASKEDV